MNIGFPLVPEQASTMAAHVDVLVYFLLAVSVFFAGLISIVIVVFVIKYRRRSEDDLPEDVHGGTWLEITWTVIPLGLTLIMFFWGAKLYFMRESPPPDSVEVTVVAKQWMWKIQHPEGASEINELHVPVGQPIKLKLISQDVIHDFSVPAFRLKQDVLPGRYTTIWFQATKPGVYHLFCDQYCGTQHSGMVGQVVVMTRPEYQKWVSGNSPVVPATVTQETPLHRLGCDTCHQENASQLAPSLVGLFGHSVKLQDGSTVTADENYIRESILNPQAKVVAGYAPIMPSFQGRISDEEMLTIMAYIKSLGREEGK